MGEPVQVHRIPQQRCIDPESAADIQHTQATGLHFGELVNDVSEYRTCKFGYQVVEAVQDAKIRARIWLLVYLFVFLAHVMRAVGRNNCAITHLFAQRHTTGLARNVNPRHR